MKCTLRALVSARVLNDLADTTHVGVTLAELIHSTPGKSISHGVGQVSFVGINKNKGLWHITYRVFGTEKYSDPRGHLVKMRFLPDPETEDVGELETEVSCDCIAKGTMIRMGDGTEQPIETLQPGDLVYTHQGRIKPITCITSRFSDPNDQPLQLTVKGYTTPLIVSSKHPVAVVRGNEICACGCQAPLAQGYVANTFRQRWAKKWVKGHYKRGGVGPDYSSGHVLWKTGPELVAREALYFPQLTWGGVTKVDLNLASLAGYYLSEGSLILRRVSSNYTPRVGLLLEHDGASYSVYGVNFKLNMNERYTLAEDIKQKVLVYDSSSKVKVRTSKLADGREWLTVSVHNPKLGLQLYKLFGKSSLTKQFSSEVLQWYPQAMLELVASFCLGDGYIGKGGTQCAFSISRNLITQISTFMFSLGIWHGFSYQSPGGNRHTLYRLNWNYKDYPTIYRAMESRLRPKDAERTYAYQAGEPSVTENTWGKGFIRSLRSIVPITYEDQFFDLTIADDHSFIANGVVVHNCGAFVFWGAQYNLKQKNALERDIWWTGRDGKKSLDQSAPTHNSPHPRNYVVCKHINAVASRCAALIKRHLIKHRESEQKRMEQQAPQEELPHK